MRESSRIPAPSERLHQEADSSGFAARRDTKSAYRAERTGKKLDAAKQKQAKQRPPKKPGPVKSARRAVQAEAWRYIHGKIYQVEQENVGIEAAHRTELAGESALRGTSRFIKTGGAPARPGTSANGKNGTSRPRPTCNFASWRRKTRN
ncbi:MAG: hypothetical protein ACLR23_14765 [Clostridia bacterium]